MKIWKVILAALVIFIAGVVTGGLTANIRHNADTRPAVRSPLRTPPPWATGKADFPQRDLLRHLEKQLVLTPAQKEHIGKLLRDYDNRKKALWEQIAPQMRDEYRSLRENIGSELGPEQKKKFQELFRPRSSSSHDGAKSPEERRRREEQRERPDSPSLPAVEPAPKQSPEVRQ